MSTSRYAHSSIITPRVATPMSSRVYYYSLVLALEAMLKQAIFRHGKKTEYHQYDYRKCESCV